MLQPSELPSQSPSRLKWRKLETIAQVRQAMAIVVKRCFDKKLDPDRANACIGGLRAIGKVLHDTDLEKRLRELELRLNQ
jgi:hypothetical protein